MNFVCRLLVAGLLATATLLAGCAAPVPSPASADPRLEVMATERAFAQSMADRNLPAFEAFIAADAVFFSGPTPLRGKASIVQGWSRHFSAAAAPFSWEPEEIEVLATGQLALSSGPVRDASGQVVARFTSIWRRKAANGWEIVFDKGSEVCRCTTP